MKILVLTSVLAEKTIGVTKVRTIALEIVKEFGMRVSACFLPIAVRQDRTAARHVAVGGLVSKVKVVF